MTLSLGTLAGWALAEAGAQLLFLRQERQWVAVRQNPAHLYRQSENPQLPYELKRSYAFTDGARRVRLNEHGVREPSGRSVGARVDVAFLGDSVAFGQGLDEADVFTEILAEGRRARGEPSEVLNLAVPGYDVADLKERLRGASAHYSLGTVVYLLNLNDFARKDSVYEGADNGLYRMYRPPAFKLPLLARKAVYRWMKGGRLVNVGWYRWLVMGNLEWGLGEIEGMQAHCLSRRCHLTVCILPAGCGYVNGVYILQDVHNALRQSLERAGIRVVDLADLLAERPREWFDSTDHLTPAGHRKLAIVMDDLLRAPVR